MTTSTIPIQNGQSIPLKKIPCVSISKFQEIVLTSVSRGGRICALWGSHWEHQSQLRIMAIVENENNSLEITTSLVEKHFPSLAQECPQIQAFEREIWEQWGVYPEHHPWLKPIRFQKPLQPIQSDKVHPRPAIDTMDFFQVFGEEIHEVGVGPVHAGVIEPGHFRFQCHGEEVIHLEITLGYQHRGVEEALWHGPHARSLHHAETLSGDTSIGHAWAYSQVVEALMQLNHKISFKAELIRGLALELERLANHIGDLGALANDIGFLSTSAFCGRLRGNVLNLTALLCGNRFGRNLIRLGGVRFDLEASRKTELLKKLETIVEETQQAVQLLWKESSVLSRFEGTGILTESMARNLGLVGFSARACGLKRDVRLTHPWGIYQSQRLPISIQKTGDVFARAYVRWLEIQASVRWIQNSLTHMPQGELLIPLEKLQPNSVALAMIEGWRGEIMHIALTDPQGRFQRYKIVDPSFHNWMGLAIALRHQPISDFPLCNKSFNLSYCGHDL